MAESQHIKPSTLRTGLLLASALMVGCGIFLGVQWLTTPRIWSLAVTEASGMAPMSNGEEGFWVINDSGGTPQVHAVSPKGHLLGSVRVPNGWNRDWESLAAGPCGPWLTSDQEPGTRCLFIGNLGTNGQIKRAPTIAVIVEPKPGTSSAFIAREVRIEYPGEGVTDRSPDVEAITLRSNGDILLFAKWAQNRPTSMVYQVTPSPMPGQSRVGPIEALQAKPVGAVNVVDTAGKPVGPFTDAALTPDQTTLFIRDYRGIYRTTVPNDSDALGTLRLTGVPNRPVLLGEALALDQSGSTLVYTSEGPLAPMLTMTVD